MVTLPGTRPVDPRERAAHNDLLRWVSERGEGSFQEFARACAELGFAATYRTATALAALGHVEFDHTHGRFSACPPTLAALPGRLPFYLLAGARRTGMWDDLFRQIDVGAEDISLYPPFAQQGGPDTLLLEGGRRAVRELCESAGITLTVTAATELARRLPHLALERVAERAPKPDARWPARGVPAGSVRADPPGGDPMESVEGACAMVSIWGRVRRWYVYLRGEWWWVPIREYAAYLTGCSMAERFPDEPFAPVVYTPAERTLRVAGDSPLPPLHARAAILCSGTLPSLVPADSGDPGAWPDQVYHDVDHLTAEAIIASLTPQPANGAPG